MSKTPAMETPVRAGELDEAAFAEWVGGVEKPLAGPDPSQKPQWVMWTDSRDGGIGHSGCEFGNTATAGARHLRIGFKNAVAAGSVLTGGGGRLSVLRPEAAYPGRLDHDSDWLEAERLDSNGELSRAEVEPGALAVWDLPPGTRTRALRFTHVAQAADAGYAGRLEGAFLTAERWTNAAPEARVSAEAQPRKAAAVSNGRRDSFEEWDNVGNDAPEAEVAALPPVSVQDPQRLILTWPDAVRIDGLNFLGAGFATVEIQRYAGPEDGHPLQAGEADWQKVESLTGINNGYPRPLQPNPVYFSQPAVTRALRLVITAPTSESGHPHLKGRTRGGRKVWLGEVMALQALRDEPLRPAARPASADAHATAQADETSRPPVAVPFRLDRPGYVTLVIEDQSGMRVRNLISETPYPAGDHTAWWDGTDDLGRDADAARHGVYRIPAGFVAPGEYTVRGLARGEIGARYEFSIYTAGRPAWETADKTGGWLTNHTPPQAALLVPADRSPTGEPTVYLGSAVSEGGAGLAWVDLEGKKLGGRGWVGGNWTAAPHLAMDRGPEADRRAYAFVGSTWTSSHDNEDRTHGELRITALTSDGDRPVLKHAFTPPASGGKDEHWIRQLGGIAVHNGLLAASLRELDTVLLIRTGGPGAVVGKAAVKSPRGLAFDTQGRLLALSGTSLLRGVLTGKAPAGAGAGGGDAAPEFAFETLTGVRGLEDPQGLALDAQGQIFVSDGGSSHQVKVFSPEGEPVRVIGRPGAPKAGLYDPLHMNHPAGMAIDPHNRLWVTENDFLPKRVSVWNPDGTLWRAFYGPSKYGGGGTLDSADKTRLLYADEGRGAMEFTLDWEKGESRLATVYYRPQAGDLPLPDRMAAPELAIRHQGRRYFTNCYNTNPTGGSAAMLFIERDGIARPVAALGNVGEWGILQAPAFAERLDAAASGERGRDRDRNRNRDRDRRMLYLWSDANDDAQAQPEEVLFHPSGAGGVTVMPEDLSLCAARIDGKAMRFIPSGFTAGGAPRYDFAQGLTLAEDVRPPASSGGDQVLAGEKGWTVVTLGVDPFAPESLSGTLNGRPAWSYPSVWPGLHAAHEAPVPDRRGQLIGTTRLLGGFVTPRGSDAGQVWAVNANMGTLHLFTADGLYVATVFEDKRLGKPWAMPAPERGMSLRGLTLSEENFWPTWTQTADGAVYVMNGDKSSLMRLEGLETIRRLPDSRITVTASDLEKSHAILAETEARRQKAEGGGILKMPLRPQAPEVDGDLSDWPRDGWVDIDKSGVAAYFNSDSKPYDVTAALAVSGDRLYAAFRTGDPNLLRNSGEVPNAPFKTGGALDLMLATDPAADPNRKDPAPGDLRLLVTRVKGAPKAILYRPVVPGTADPVPFSSPWRTITLDRVDDVSGDIRLAGADGRFEFSIPLKTLGLNFVPGQTLKGDIGILRSTGSQTTTRVYWSNKATGITSDVPSEAMLAPGLWGRMGME